MRPTTVKLIAAGYGAGCGPHMVLTCQSGTVHADMEKVMLGYSCYPPALPTIRSCLEASGRYDCWVQPGWIYHQHSEVARDLASIGIQMFITSVPSHDLKQAARNKLKVTKLDEHARPT